MKTQEDYLKEILKLKANDPTLEIKFLVSSDDMTDWDYTEHQICKVEVSPWYVNDEGRIFIGMDDVMDGLITDTSYIYEKLDDEEFSAIVNKRYEKEIKQVICVYTCA